jgi:hypothetical protein
MMKERSDVGLLLYPSRPAAPSVLTIVSIPVRWNLKKKIEIYFWGGESICTWEPN